MLPMGLLNDRKKTSVPPVQNCCTLRVKEGCYCIAIFPQFFRNVSAIGFEPPPRAQPPPP